MSIEAQVYDIIKQLLDTQEITLESNLVDDLSADELDMIELKMALEEQFNIQVPDEELERFKTVWDIVYFIQLHRSE
ncbi:acyl carrier protein [Aspergillus granulosus]|uniref:Acyl carrier protein n=1 Tax=Aspergillus granulosus TaxID=176169 RepID=A0ABR4HSD3_9EURO